MVTPQFEPVAVSIVLSDLVICEQGTGKNSLIGCFNNFNFPQFPFPTPPFTITVALTRLMSAIVDYDVVIRIEDPKNGNVLRSAGSHLSLGEPVMLTKETVIEVPIGIMPFMVPQAGHYTILVLVNNEQAGKRTFTFNSLTAPATPPK